MERIIKWLKSHSYNMQVIMMIIGGYICYLGYQLLTDAKKTEGSVIPIYIFAVLFLVCGAFLACVMLYGLVKGYNSDKNPAPELPEDDADGEPAELDEDSDETDEPEETVDR